MTQTSKNDLDRFVLCIESREPYIGYYLLYKTKTIFEYKFLPEIHKN